MATKSFRIFATKEDLFSIFSDFQQNVKIHYFKCGRMYDLIETSDITKDSLFGINQKGNLLNSQLWKQLIDKNMKRIEMQHLTGISANILARMGKNQYVSMETVEKICKKMNCTIDEMMEFTD